MVVIRSDVVTDRLRLAVSRLMATRVDGERARLTVPVLYPSGGSCAVEIVTSGERCFVSDLAMGHMEAEMYGAHDLYDVCAKAASERFGVRYDGLSVFASWASLDNVEGAIIGVANASAYAATTAIFRAVEEKERQKNYELFEKVQAIFGEASVAKTADLSGRDAQWQAHNVVILRDHRRAVFEFVSEAGSSIASKFLMFSDLSKREGEFSLNSVVKSVESIGKKGSMLGDVSNIIPLTAPHEDFIRFAEAA